MEGLRYVDATGRPYKPGQIIAIADRLQTRAVIRFAKVLAITVHIEAAGMPAVPALRIQSYERIGKLKRPAVMTRLDAAIILQPIQVPADVEEAFEE